jgi:formin-binding protein 1
VKLLLVYLPSFILTDEQRLLDTMRSLVMLENEKVTLETEIHTVFTAVNDIDAGARPHSFKSTTFVSPQTCAFCNKSIWGLGASGKGFVCTGMPLQVIG